jgi:hypothetical protein
MRVTMAVGDVGVLRSDFMYAEAPRWHDGRLYVSDFYANEAVALDVDGARECIVRVAAPKAAFRANSYRDVRLE